MNTTGARSLYVTAMEPMSGKSVVSLGLMETLSTRVDRAGFFRPIVADGPGPDPQIELIRRRFRLPESYEAMFALSAGEAAALVASGDQDELEQRVFDAYKALEARCDVIVCEGTDFSGVAAALDFELNATLANQLGCPVLLVVRGGTPARVAANVRVARGALARKDCQLFGVIVNRVEPEALAEMREHSVIYDRNEPMYVIAESPELAHPTVAEVGAALGAEVVLDGSDALQREVKQVLVAAMSVEHFIERLVTDGTLVIVPGDRPDILVASLASTLSPSLPAVAGIVLTGGFSLPPAVHTLLMDAPFAVLAIDTGTYEAAAGVHGVAPTITAESGRKIATALGAFEAGVDGIELVRRLEVPRRARVTPMMFQHELIERARSRRRRVVLPEGDDARVLAAADILLRRDVLDLTILGRPEDVRARASSLGYKLDAAAVLDPASAPERELYASRYHELRSHRGVTREIAYDAVADPCYFGTMMVHGGAADGMVSGAAHTTADTIRPAFEVIRGRAGGGVVSSVFFMCMADRVLVYGDCAVNPKPDSEQLASIAISSADTAASFGIEVRVAMLSYSTGGSGHGAGVELVAAATAIARERRPELKVEGPIQYDAAVDETVAAMKLPGSEVAGQATVLIFPDLDTGNVAYKAVQRSSGAIAIGPVLQGLRKPVNDLSRGCTVPDVVNTIVITAIQAQADPAGLSLA